MNLPALVFLAFCAGMLLAMQNGLSAHLGQLLRSPLLAAAYTFFASAVLAAIFFLGSNSKWPSASSVREIPLALWLSCGICSTIALTLYYFTIPRLGLSTVIAIGMSGQLVFSVVAGHFGWLGLPTEPVSARRLLGVLALVIGVILVNGDRY